MIEKLKSLFKMSNVKLDLNTTILGCVLFICATVLIITGHITLAQGILPEVLGVVLLFLNTKKDDDSTE